MSKEALAPDTRAYFERVIADWQPRQAALPATHAELRVGMNDADACASLDSFRMALYFLSRGDEPVNGAGPLRSILQRSRPQAYIVYKQNDRT